MNSGKKFTFVIVDGSGRNDCSRDNWNIVVDIFDGDVDDGEVDDGIGGEIDEFNDGANSRNEINK